MLHLVAALIRTIVTSTIVTAFAAWAGRLLARIVARQLHVPEALVHDAGRYVYARIDHFERRLLRSLTTSLAERS